MNIARIEEVLFTIGKYFLIIHPPTRDWVFRQGRHYAAIVIAALLAESVLITLGILIPWEVIPAITFFLAIILLLITYIPFSIAESLITSRTLSAFAWRATHDVYPSGIRHLVAWLAFAGWLGIVYNPWLNLWTVLIAIFLFFMFDGLRQKRRSQYGGLNPVILCFVVILTVWVALEYTSPTFHNSISRLYLSTVKRSVADQNRQSNRNEAIAAVTYGHTNRDIKVVYTATDDANGELIALSKHPINLPTASRVKLVSPEKEVKVLDGQGFIKIQLPDPSYQNSFVGGTKYWIEADYLDIISPADLVGDKKSKKDDQTVSATSSPVTNPKSNSSQIGSQARIIRESGVYTFDLKAGESTGFIGFEEKRIVDVTYSSPDYDYTLNYDDGTSYVYGDTVPIKRHCNVNITANSDQRVTMDVKYRQPAANQTAGL